VQIDDLSLGRSIEDGVVFVDVAGKCYQAPDRLGHRRFRGGQAGLVALFVADVVAAYGGRFLERGKVGRWRRRREFFLFFDHQLNGSAGPVRGRHIQWHRLLEPHVLATQYPSADHAE